MNLPCRFCGKINKTKCSLNSHSFMLQCECGTVSSYSDIEILGTFIPFNCKTYIQPVVIKIASCECGIDAIGGGIHSFWCPKS